MINRASGVSQKNPGVPERKKFRFKTWRPTRPPNMLRVDEAIDQVGVALFSDEWGRQSHFDDLPLFWKKGRTGIYGLEEKGKSFTRVDIVEQSPEIAELANTFRLVYRTLRKGMRRYIDSSAVTREGDQLELNQGILYRQLVSIFGAGTVKLDRERCPVWIRESSFRAWFDDEFMPELELTVDLREALIPTVKKHYNENSRRVDGEETKQGISRPQMDDLVKNWLKMRLKRSDLEQLMQDLPKEIRKGGRPNWEGWDEVKASMLKELRSQAVSKGLNASK